MRRWLLACTLVCMSVCTVGQTDIQTHWVMEEAVAITREDNSIMNQQSAENHQQYTDLVTSLKQQLKEIYKNRLSDVMTSLSLTNHEPPSSDDVTVTQQPNKLLRQKRHELNEPSSRQYTSSSGVGVLIGQSAVRNESSIPATGAQHVHVFEHEGTLYAVAAFGAGSTTGLLLKLQKGVWVEVSEFRSRGTRHFTSFSTINGSRYVIGAEFESSEDRYRRDKLGSVLYQLVDERLHYRHTLPQLHPTDVTVWRDHSTIFIGVSSFFGLKSDVLKNSHYQHSQSSESLNSSMTHHVHSSVFKWVGGDFQEVTFSTSGAMDLEHFHIHSHQYLAVANFVDDYGNHNIYSEILRFNLASQRYERVQRLLTHGAVKMRHFQWGRDMNAEHFLVVANQVDQGLGDEQPNYHVNSVIYKLHENQFVPFQCIATVKVHDILPVWGVDSGEFALIVADSESVRLYQYTGWLFVLVHSLSLYTTSTPVLLDSFLHDGHVHITVGSAISPQNMPVVFRLTFTRRDDARAVDTALTHWCDVIRNEVSKAWHHCDDHLASLQAAPKKHDDVSFKSLTINTTGYNTSLQHVSVQHMFLTDSAPVDVVLLDSLASISETTQESLLSLRDFQVRLEQAVRLDENFTFNNDVFVEGDLTLNTALVEDLRTSSLNSKPELWEFINSAIYVDESSTSVLTHLHFRHLYLPQQSRVYTRTINGNLNTSSWVSLTRSHVITAHKQFVAPVSATSVTSARVNDLLINSNTTVSFDSLPHGSYRFSEFFVSKLSTRLINGVDVNNILDNYVSSSQSVFPGCRFAAAVNISLLTSSLLNNVPVQRLLDQTLKTTSQVQVITAPWTVGSLHTDTLLVDGGLNSVRVPQDLIMISHSNETFSLLNATAHSLHIHQLHVTSSLGPLNVKNGEVQVLLLNSSTIQTISAEKKIERLITNSDWRLDGDINGLTVTQQQQQQQVKRHIRTNLTYLDVGELSVGRVQIDSEMTVNGTINNVHIPRLLLQFLPLNNSVQPSIICDQNVQFEGGVQIERVNNIAPSSWLRSDTDSQMVTGDKQFDSVHVDNALTIDYINEHNMSQLLESTLLKHSDQTVLAPVLFLTPVLFHKVWAESLLWAGWNISNIVTNFGPHTIKGEKTYLSCDILMANLSVNHLIVNGLVDGVNLTSLLQHSRDNQDDLLSDQSQMFFNNLTVDHVTVDSPNPLHNNLLQLLQLATSNTIRANVTFLRDTPVEELIFEGSMDGVSSATFGSSWLTTQGGHSFLSSSSITTSYNISVLDLVMEDAAIFNQQLAGDLLRDFVPLTSDSQQVTINGDVHIASVAAPWINISSLQADMDNLARNDRVNIFSRHLVFSGSLFISGQLHTARVNNINVSTLCGSVNRKNNDNSFTVLRVHGDVLVQDGRKLHLQQLNNIELSWLNETLWLRDSDQIIERHVTLNHAHFLTLNSSLIFTDDERGRQVELLLQDYLLNYWHRARAAVITGHVVFNNPLIVENLQCVNLLVESCLNDVHFQTLLDSTLTQQGGRVTGVWNISQLLVTENFSVQLLNSQPVSNYIIESDGVVEIGSNIIVDKLLIDGDLVLPEAGTVFGYHVPTSFNISMFLMKNSSAVINCDVLFLSDLVSFSQPLTVVGLVNGHNITVSSVLTSSGSQTSLGAATISSNIDLDTSCVRAHVAAKLIAGLDLHKLLSQAVRLNGTYNVTANWTFINPPYLTHTASTDNITASHLNQLNEMAATTLNNLQHADSTALQFLHTTVQLHERAREAAAPTALYLQRFQLSQRWRRSQVLLFVPLPATWSARGRHVSAHVLAVQQSSVSVLHWNSLAPRDTWTEGVRYADLSHVTWASSLAVSSNVTFVAMSRSLIATSQQQQHFTTLTSFSQRLNNSRQYFDQPVNLIFRFARGKLELHQVLAANKTVDVKGFVPTPGVYCFIFVNFAGSGSPVLCNSGAGSGYQFVHHQVLPTERARQAAVYGVGDDDNCVMVADMRAVSSWCWQPDQHLLTAHHKLTVTASSLSVAQLGSRVVLALAHVASPKLRGLVDVYSLDDRVGEFAHVQTLPAQQDGVRSVSLLVLPSRELLVVIISEVGRVSYATYTGLTWFSHFSHFSTSQASSLTAFCIGSNICQLAVGGAARGDMFSSSSTPHLPAAFYTANFLGDGW